MGLNTFPVRGIEVFQMKDYTAFRKKPTTRTCFNFEQFTVSGDGSMQ
jgi:hypothetical protein